MSKILFWQFGWQFFSRGKNWQHFLVWQKNIWESLHWTKCHWQPFNIQQQVDCPLFLSIFYLHLQNSSLSRLADLSIHNSSSSPAPNKSPGTRVSLFHKLFLALSATLLVFDTINHRDRLLGCFILCSDVPKVKKFTCIDFQFFGHFGNLVN